MNYDKLTKNSGITKNRKKRIRKEMKEIGLELEGDGKMEQITDEIVSFRIKASKKVEKEFAKFQRDMDAKDWEIYSYKFHIWFMHAHNLICKPADPNEDEYVRGLWDLFLVAQCFPNNSRYQESLDVVWDPEYREVRTPLKYKSADLLEVA